MSLESICCPTCHHPLPTLEEDSSTQLCSRCGASYAARQGVIDFIPHDDFYWGEVAQDKMNLINKQALDQGWVSAIRENLADRASLIGYIMAPARVGWLFHCYDEHANEACLDIGSGWGSLSFPLSRFYQTVYSVDGVYERLHFQSIRAKQDNVHNIKLLRSELLKLPLPDNAVDLVVLNGILEWIGLSDLQQKPDELQMAFLKEVRRVLKPTGALYLGIENRLGAQYFLGHIDHSNLPFTSLVPRWLANLIVKKSKINKKNKSHNILLFSNPELEYRTYTYSAWGYSNMLRQAGFPQSEFYWTWSGYNYPQMSGPLDGKNIKYMANRLKNELDTRWLRALIGLGTHLPEWLIGWLIKIFSPYFLIIARPQSGKQTIQETALQRAPKASSFVRLTIGRNTTVKTTFLLLDQNGVAKSVRVSEKPDSSNKSSFIYEEAEGIKGRPINPDSQSEVRAAAHWLADFHHKKTAGQWSTLALEEEIVTLSEAVQRLPECQALAATLNTFTDQYIEAVRATPLPIITEHGDYTRPNIILSPTGELHVIDWEYSRESGNPLLDVGAFALSLLRRKKELFTCDIEPNSPLYWFAQEYGNRNLYVPISVAPAYYLLRVVNRIMTSTLNESMTHHALLSWIPLLERALAYSQLIKDSK